MRDLPWQSYNGLRCSLQACALQLEGRRIQMAAQRLVTTCGKSSTGWASMTRRLWPCQVGGWSSVSMPGMRQTYVSQYLHIVIDATSGVLCVGLPQAALCWHDEDIRMCPAVSRKAHAYEQLGLHPAISMSHHAYQHNVSALGWKDITA